MGSFVLLLFYGDLLCIYRFSSNFACPYLAPTCFSEVIRPRYGPDGRYGSFSISNTPMVSSFPQKA